MTTGTGVTITEITQLALAALALWVSIALGYRQTSPKTTARRLLVAGVVVIATLFGGAAVWQAREQWMTATEDRLVRETVLAGTDAEIEAYKRPADDAARTDVLRYFAERGARLAQIDYVRRCKLVADRKRYADTASHSIVITDLSLSPDRRSATVQTKERVYQPLVQRQPDGRELPVTQTAAQLNLDLPDEVYRLRKLDGRWLIESNPSPQNPTTTSCD